MLFLNYKGVCWDSLITREFDGIPQSQGSLVGSLNHKVVCCYSLITREFDVIP
jgi:hypothetical protein